MRSTTFDAKRRGMRPTLPYVFTITRSEGPGLDSISGSNQNRRTRRSDHRSALVAREVSQLANKTKNILIRGPAREVDQLQKAKLEISNKAEREVTWLEILKVGVATELAYGRPRGKK